MRKRPNVSVRKQVRFIDRALYHNGPIICVQCGNHSTDNGLSWFIVEPVNNRSMKYREFWCFDCMAALPETNIIRRMAAHSVVFPTTTKARNSSFLRDNSTE